MLKMLISMNREKIFFDKKYRLDGIEGTICKLFENAGFHRLDDETDSLIYEGNNSSRDFGKFGKIVNTLKRQPWFMENVAEWRLYDSDDSDNPYDYNEEDLLQHYRKKNAVGV